MAAATGHTSAFHNTPLAKQLMTPKNTTPKPLATPTGHFFYDQPSLPALSPTLVTPATPATPAPPQFPLHLACRKNNKAAALDLIASAPELIQTTDANGMLPLHHAAIRCAHLSIIEALVIPFRASIFATDAAGKTPLNYADQYFASEATLIALNDKRRKLRDDKVREAAEAERERVRCLEEEAAKLAEDDKRETVEVLERELEELVDVGAQFLDAVDPIKISAPTTIMPFPNEQLTRVETTLAALSVVVAAKTSHPDRLEAFLKVANVGPVELNSAVRKWATKLKNIVKNNNSFKSNDAITKLLVLVGLDDPIGNKKGRGALEELGIVLKEMAWRFKKIKVCQRCQLYHNEIEQLHGEFKAAAWESRAEQDRLSESIGVCINRVDVTAGPAAVELERSYMATTKRLREVLQNDLKELRMMNH